MDGFATDLKLFASAALYIVALINPISKVFVLSTLANDLGRSGLRSLALRASGIALVILLAFAVLGNALLTMVFHVELYSFQIVGGLVLFFAGFKALTRGVFYEQDEHKSLAEMAIVPLASPMIAGPATLTAAISFPAHYGMRIAIPAMIAALFVNLVVMLFSAGISRALRRYNLMGALIRITGMVVATIAVQMVLTGIQTWHATLKAAA